MIKKTKMVVMDFDGTLVSTPLPDTGKIIYQEKTGKPWPFQGWWGRELSLDMDIFDIPVINSVIDAYNTEKGNTTTLMVMLTGRRHILKDSVIKILDFHGLEFDEYHFNKGGATEVAKMKTIDDLLVKYSNISEIDLFDDRLEHISIFEQFLKEKVKSGQLKKFKITVVPSDNHK